MYARIFFSQLRMGVKITLRTPAAVFWVVAFPIVMLLGLGLIFGGATDSRAHLVWAHGGPTGSADAAFVKALQERGLAVETLAPEAAEERWKLGKLPALLQGADSRYTLRINAVLAAQGMQTEATVQQAYLIAQARALGEPEPARIPVVMASAGGRHGGPYTAYLLPGLLGLNLLVMGIFSTGIVDVMLRQKGGYKRLATTPLPRAVYLAASVSVRLCVVIFAAASLLTVGWLVFGIRSQGSLFAVAALLILGAACFISLGYVLGSLVSSVETYNGVSNLVFLPLMLLSGVYFSLDAAPAWLQQAVEVLPLAPLLRALRAVFIDGATLASQTGPIAVVAAWTLGLFVLATRRFKWM